MNSITIAYAAAKKNVSRGAVTQAVAAGHIHQTKIKDVPHILENRAFENWKPGKLNK